MHAWQAAIFVAFAVSLRASVAQAQDPLCAPDATPIGLRVTAPDPRTRAGIEQEFAAEQRRGSFCVSDTNAIARVAIDLAADGRANIVVTDSVTQKTVMRTVNVREFPADARPLALAIAADELLRASWAELTVRPKAQKNAAPAAVVARVRTPDEAAEGEPFALSTEIGARANLIAYAGGQTQFGGAVYLRHDLVSYLTIEVYGFGREALPTNTALGSVLGHAGGGGANLVAWLLHAGPARFGIAAGTELSAQVFEGRAEGANNEDSFTSLVVVGQLGLELGIDLAPLRLATSLFGLVPFRGAEAISDSEVVTAVSGPGISAAIGAGGVF